MSEAATLAGIVWLASYPKSGNTWTRAFLTSLIRQSQGLSAEPEGMNGIAEFSSWEIGASNFEDVLGKPVDQATPDEIAAGRLEVQRRIADASDRVALVKTHNALVADRGRPVINLDVTSGVIYVVRNPLDVAVSFAHHMGKDIDTAITRMETDHLRTGIENAAFEIYGSWSQNVESWTRRPNRALYVMRYEDMLAGPHAAFGALARHLAIPHTALQLDRAIEAVSFDRLRSMEDREAWRETPKTAERFFRKGQAGQWKTALTQAQVDRVIAAHGAQMHRFGYLD